MNIFLTGLNSIKGVKRSRNLVILHLKGGGEEEYEVTDPPLAIQGVASSVKTYSLTDKFEVNCSNGLRAEVDFEPACWREKRSRLLSFFGNREEESKLAEEANSDWTARLLRQEGKLAAHFCRVSILANEEGANDVEIDSGIGTWLGHLKFDSDNDNNYNPGQQRYAWQLGLSKFVDWQP